MFGIRCEVPTKSGQVYIEEKPIKRTLASWLSNSPQRKKDKENTNPFGQDVIQTHAKYDQSTTKLGCVAGNTSVAHKAVKQKSQGGYVISKPSPIHQSEYERSIRTVFVEQILSAPAADVGTYAMTDIQDKETAQISLKREQPVSLLSTLYNPSRRNFRLPATLNGFPLGHRTAMATFAPGTTPFEMAQVVPDSLAFALALDDNIPTKVDLEAPQTTTTTIDPIQYTSNADDLTRSEFATHAPQLPTSNSFASALSSAFQPPASQITIQITEEGTNATFDEAVIETSLGTSEDLETAKRISFTTKDIDSRDASSARDVEGISPPLEPSSGVDAWDSFDEMLRRANEEYERHMGGEVCAASFADEQDVSIEAQTDSASVVGSDRPTWDELQQIADREYEERLLRGQAFETLSTSVSALSPDDRFSVMEELSDVDWDEWRREDEEQREYCKGNTLRGEETRKSVRRAPRVVAYVVTLFRVGKGMVRLLAGDTTISPLSNFKFVCPA
ncbi:hypothetical protein FRB94_008492 [Tulasnella sp. JGI-2019a]|nr:hypothetical protein FRB94_008492 [Tulasnella sp. JGI-2019a]